MLSYAELPCANDGTWRLQEQTADTLQPRNKVGRLAAMAATPREAARPGVRLPGSLLGGMSLSGAAIVFRDDVSRTFSLEWLVRFHSETLAREYGPNREWSRGNPRDGGRSDWCVYMVAGIKHWRRSLTVSWRAHFPRISWDLHSALGFWCLRLVLLWGISGIYLSLPQSFNVLYLIDRRDRFADSALFWLSQLHFGRFGLFATVHDQLVAAPPPADPALPTRVR